MSRKPAPMPAGVTALRAALDKEDIAWSEVRDYPRATYLPGAVRMFTIWWMADDGFYLWGHHYEYKDATADDVIARLKEM